jgi:protein involved in polysaccharide export with SLBB domain
MIWKGWISTLGLLVLAITWSGCVAPGGQTLYVCADDDIRVGDMLVISLLDIGETPMIDKAFVVRGDGTVNLPLMNGPIKAAGKKFGQFERDVQTTYITNNIYKRVTVVVKPGDRFYSVGGEVKSPGRQIYAGQTTVLRAIVTCGDFTEFANRRKVEIIRSSGDREIMDCKKAREDPKKKDRPLCPGDAIFVPRSL